ncbi:MAG TPA: Rid family hydrolase [Stellaceae bacterium]|jgi:enamine deaminase RidA (YjgF/YER057c/UK114 family)|nr:Rid family hydrolase [Stellaceae bacterium]
MPALEVKSVDNLLGTPVAYAYAVKAGPWIFLTGHEAFDFASGIPNEVGGPAGFPLYAPSRSRREGDFILRRMRRILREMGADLANAVRLDQYYPTPKAVHPYHLARHAEFGDYIPPSTSVVMERCFGLGSTISTSLIAAAPGPGREIRMIYPPGVASSPSSGFVPAVVCNDFVFVAGQMAHDSGHGLDPRAQVSQHSAWAESAIRKQTEFLIAHKLEPALAAAGSSLARSLKAQVYLANLEDFPDFLDVWGQHFADIPCAVTVVPTKSFATAGGIIEINLLALTNTASRKKEVIDADIPGMAAYGPCIKVGEFLLPSGLMAIGRDGQVAGRSLSAGFEGLSHAGCTQAALVYDYAEALCRAAGTSMANLLRAQYFVADIDIFPGVTMAWSARFGTRPHPFSCVATPPAMAAAGMALIADLWIATSV